MSTIKHTTGWNHNSDPSFYVIIRVSFNMCHKQIYHCQLILTDFSIFQIQWSLSKPNIIGLLCSEYTGYIYIEVKLTTFITLGLYLKFGLYRILVYSGFCLDRFHCTIEVFARANFFVNKYKCIMSVLTT